MRAGLRCSLPAPLNGVTVLIVTREFSTDASEQFQHRNCGHETCWSKMTDNILFLCTGNSARSIMAEAILNDLGDGRFKAFSAGSQPKGRVHPETLRLLQSLGHATSELRSKSWDEFAHKDHLAFNHIITVCNNAAGEACPIIPGKPAKLHWDIPDPAAAKGTPEQIASAFRGAYDMLSQRIRAFTAEPS
jgi:protein-tyrosine-phosphatase